MMGGCICKRRKFMRFFGFFFPGKWREDIYDCAHSCITDKMKLAEDVTDLVTGCPCWTEKRNDFIRRILELHREKRFKKGERWKRREEVLLRCLCLWYSASNDMINHRGQWNYGHPEVQGVRKKDFNGMGEKTNVDCRVRSREVNHSQRVLPVRPMSIRP